MRRWLSVIALFVLGMAEVSLAAPSSRGLQKARELINRAKQEGWTFEVGYNPVMEYSLDEVTGLVMPETWRDGQRFVTAAPKRLPSHFDWREEAGLTPIKSQKNCGSCWAFGTVAVLEQIIKIREHLTVSLSEQQLVSCNKDGYGCDGGWTAHKYHVSPGATTNQQFPYVAKDVPCKSGLAYSAKIPSWGYVGGSESTPSNAQIKNAIHDFGPVAATVTANSAMTAYQGGIFNACASGQINHLVNIVGWDDEGGYWIMRNSWGESWGEQGYMRIKYNCSRLGEMATFVNYKPACSPQPLPFTGGDKQIFKGDSTFLGGMPIPGQSYLWSPSEGLDSVSSARPLANPSRNMTYTLKVTNECGTAEQTVKVMVKPI